MLDEGFRGIASFPNDDGVHVDIVDFERIHGAKALDAKLAVAGLVLNRTAKIGEPVFRFTSDKAADDFQRQVLTALHGSGIDLDDGERTRH